MNLEVLLEKMAVEPESYDQAVTPHLAGDVPIVKIGLANLEKQEAILVKDGSREEFAQAMVGLCSNPEEIGRIGGKAGEKSRQFSIDIANERILDICQSLISRSQ